MELPKRAAGDVYTPSGRYRELESELRQRVACSNIPMLFVYAFDYRTRVGPFLFVDRVFLPGAALAVGAALKTAGFLNTRLVMQQWSPNVRPSAAKLSGKRPEVLLVSAMFCHSAAAYRLIRDAWTLGTDRPLVIAGGPKAIYQPEHYFGLSEDGEVGADIVVTGEQFVLIELLHRITEHKSAHESMRTAFERVRREGLLEDIPGLVYRPDDGKGPPLFLTNTGIQRLVQNLDEHPLATESLDLFEIGHRRKTLSDRPAAPTKIRRHAKILAMVTTQGCKFRCSYCPIPAYNQFTFRYKSPERVVEEMSALTEQTGIKLFFGTDDNFFNNREAVVEILTAMSKGRVNGKPMRDAIAFATEATEFDVHKNQDLLPLARDAGVRQIWFGVEDMTGQLVKKGQSVNKTEELFRLLVKNGIAPHPMLMYHDGQPFYTRDSHYGLFNQVRHLRRVGACSVQITFLSPLPGTKGEEQPYTDGMVINKAGGVEVEEYLHDGNHIVATEEVNPLRKQLHMALCYAYFYNPFFVLRNLVRFDQLWFFRMLHQMLGVLRIPTSLFNDRGWLFRLFKGPVEKFPSLPELKYPMVAAANSSVRNVEELSSCQSGNNAVTELLPQYKTALLNPIQGTDS